MNLKTVLLVFIGLLGAERWYIMQITNTYYNKIRKISRTHWRFLQGESTQCVWQDLAESLIVNLKHSKTYLMFYIHY